MLKKMSDSQERTFIRNFTRNFEDSFLLDTRYFDTFNVKKGLRNSDGTGVLVGLTEIGEVHGYLIEDGHKVAHAGRLRYRGIDLYDLVSGFQTEKRYGFEEIVFLLLFRKLPTIDELAAFCTILSDNRALPEDFTEDLILKAPSNDIMNKLARSILALYSYDENPDTTTIENLLLQSIHLVAKLPLIVAYSFQSKIHHFEKESLYIHEPKRELSTSETLLRLIRPSKNYTPLEAETLDLSLVIHAEHGGGNNSAFTTRVVSSSGTDTYSAIAASIGSLKGDLHGGACMKTRAMIEDAMLEIKNWDNQSEVREYLTLLLQKKKFDNSGLIYGMGHAVYTLSDPRAVLLKQKARELALEKGFEKEYELHNSIETLTPEIMSEFKGRPVDICANVDFYSGFVYHMLNIPSDLFTPIFAVARISSWCAHRIEELALNGKIIRPSYVAIAQKQNYVTLGERE